MNNKELRISHPGKYIKKAIDELSITQNEFAVRVGLSSKIIDALINEKSNITVEVANKLASFFDNSTDFWMNLQNKYDSFLSLEKNK